MAKVEALPTISEMMVSNDGMDQKRFEFVKKESVLKILSEASPKESAT